LIFTYSLKCSCNILLAYFEHGLRPFSKTGSYNAGQLQQVACTSFQWTLDQWAWCTWKTRNDKLFESLRLIKHRRGVQKDLDGKNSTFVKIQCYKLSCGRRFVPNFFRPNLWPKDRMNFSIHK
jgi:hypothetical protein